MCGLVFAGGTLLVEDVGVRVELESLDELLRARETLLTMLVALLLEE